ncbi:Phage-related protein, tail component [Rhizobium sp. RU35A]|uniref:TipJ family phage tail tip protein n=1 Tax=Rhizobium sp. RU35A TaxID=1907414 RepID=UPI0009540744|nr:phage tail protein [Rhizobium sp. RU35A]SIR16315.1 Phage-related protein, tail component [Rhizobium sp. RU35A]
MTQQTGLIPVLAAPALDPGTCRIERDLPPGLTIAEIVDLVIPDRAIGREYIRVALVTDRGSQIVPPAIWHCARPHPGVRVVIRVIPGKSVLRSILQIVVSIAAIALGQYWAAAYFGGSVFASAAIGIGISVLGNLLINALIPPVKPKNQDRENRYSITGWRNRAEPDGAIPVPLGSIRYAPPFAALSYNEIVGNWLYIRSLFCCGYGRLSIDDMRIGETSLSEYDEVEVEVRDGVSTDTPIGLFPRQVAEENIGTELTRPYPRDDLGNIIGGSTPQETPVTRTTGADASGASVILAWPSGLYATNDNGSVRDTSVSVKIQQRLASADSSAAWTDVVTLNITARSLEAFYRQHTWDFPSRGRWQVRLVMMTGESTDIRVQQRTSWAALQTIRPEYPLNFGQPLALVALRIKATHQLNGQLDNFNARLTRVCLDYDHTTGTWIERATRNPASLFRYVLQSPANPRPVSDSGIDLEQLIDWHNFCRLKDLKYDRVLDDGQTSLGDVLAEVAAAGRASPRHDGVRWGVVIDRQQTLVIDHINPRNAYSMKCTRTYVRPPDGFRVKFLDETNDHASAERLVPWPGHTGDITLTEALELPGKTDPVEVYREARRRMYETIHRPDVYQASQDGPVRVATRGDLVMLSMDTLDRTQSAPRVISAEGRMVELSDPVTMAADGVYGLRVRVFADETDSIGTSVLRRVRTVAGETRVLALVDDGVLPAAGDIVHFGSFSSDSIPVIIQGGKSGEDFSMHYRMIDAAPIIDQLVDAEVIPAWNGRVGAEVDGAALQPPAPRFTSISSGVSETGAAGLVSYLIVPGSGAIPSATFVVEHRLSGATSWTPLTIPAANGGGQISGYANGDVVQMRAYARSASNVSGPVTPMVTFTVGAFDAAIPVALNASMITFGPLLGGAVVQWSTSDDTATTQVQIYRSTSSTLNRSADSAGAPVAVVPSRSYSQPIGDATRENLLTNGNMESAGTWTLGPGWTIAGGKASHTPGTADAISQPLAAVSGKYYRISGQIADVTAGTVTSRLTGGSTRTGVAQSTNGIFTDRIQAVTGNDTFSLLASSAFDGSIDNVVAYLETATCLAQGTHYIWLEPQNADGLPGPVSGPFTVNIR